MGVSGAAPTGMMGGWLALHARRDRIFGSPWKLEVWNEWFLVCKLARKGFVDDSYYLAISLHEVRMCFFVREPNRRDPWCFLEIDMRCDWGKLASLLVF